MHLVDSMAWREITGEPPPETPVTAKEYARAGLPWFELYDEDRGALEGAARLAAVKSVKELDAAKSDAPQQSDDPVGTPIVKKLWASLAGAVRDGDW